MPEHNETTCFWCGRAIWWSERDQKWGVWCEIKRTGSRWLDFECVRSKPHEPNLEWDE